MLLIGAALALALSTAAQSQAPQRSTAVQTDVATSVRRAAATAQLAAQEYRVGVVDGRVVAQAEVEEARLFLQEARRSAASLPPGRGTRRPATSTRCSRWSRRSRRPTRSTARSARSAGGARRRLGVTLDELPAKTPSLARGAEVYQANCAGCHGDAGRAATGRSAAGLEPPPANLADWRRPARRLSARLLPPHQHRHRRHGHAGVRGPASGRGSLGRRAVRQHAPAARAARRGAAVAPRLRHERQDVRRRGPRRARRAPTTAIREALGRLAAVRTFQADHTGAATAQVFDQVRAPARLGLRPGARPAIPAASARAFDAYMTFEQVERGVRAKNPALAAELETAFASLRTRAAGGADAGRARRAARGSSTPGSRTPSARWATGSRPPTSSSSRSSSCCARGSRRS